MNCSLEGEGIFLLADGAHEPIPDMDTPTTTVETKVPDLSFILHPSHERSRLDKASTSARRPSDASNSIHQNIAIDRACSVLGLERVKMKQLIETYFDNMVAVNLFHQPSFFDKLGGITSPTQVTALLAAMFAISVRFCPDGNGLGDKNKPAAHFLDLALRYLDDALRECGDHTPPLCLLQAFIIAAHCQLTQGVLGRAWRALGTCVRLAYEMNLHLIDARVSTAQDVDQWCEDEEKRRSWWAIWEMDVFATTIRRTPTAVDWSQLETLLPVDDEHWFERKPQTSCFLERDPMQRWKALEGSGNQSSKAWYIVVNSLMKEAQRISSPRGVPSRRPSADRMDEARKRLEIIANAVQCFQLALPEHLKYHHQHLGFDARVPGQVTSVKQAHCSIYNIYVMSQLARLMIYRYDVFKGRLYVAFPSHEADTTANHDDLAVKEYFAAADDMLTIIHRSCDDHIKYINPFLSNTIWLASAVHLMRSQLCQPGTTKSVVKSRYEVLHLTYKKCVSFWDMQTAVQQNLETLEKQLEAWQQSNKRQTSRTSSPKRLSQNTATQNMPTSSLPNAEDMNNTTSIIPTPPSSHGFYTTDWQTEIPRGDSMLDSLRLVPSMDANTIANANQATPSATLIDPMFLIGTTQTQVPWIENSRAMDVGPDIDWMPNDLQDILF